MTAAAAIEAGKGAGTDDGKGGGKAGGGKKKLILLALPILLGLIGAGLWFSGILPGLLGMKHAASGEHANAEGKGAEGKGAAAKEAGKDAGKGGEGEAKAVFVDMPDMIANLNGNPRHATYVKLHVRLQLARPQDEAAVKAAMPRLLDLFQTYLREMRPEELRGSIGTYRLREELLSRADIAVAPAHIVDVLFTEMIVQ